MQEPKYEPTPEQIEDECRRIRESWTEHDHWVRSGHEDGQPEAVVPRSRICIE